MDNSRKNLYSPEDDVEKLKNDYIQQYYEQYKDQIYADKLAEVRNNTAKAEAIESNQHHDEVSEIDKQKEKLLHYDASTFEFPEESKKEIDYTDPFSQVDKKDTETYQNIFEALFAKDIEEKNAPPQDMLIPQDVKPSDVDYNEIQNMNFSSIRNELHKEGYKFRSYVKKDTTNYYVNKYYYINKVIFHTFLIMYFVLFVEGLITYFAGRHSLGLSFKAFAIIYVIMTIFPIGATINYYTNKQVKTRKVYDLYSTLVNSLSLTLNCILIISLLGFFVFDIDAKNMNRMMVYLIIPMIFTINIPLTALILVVLSKSQRYYIV